MLALCRVAKVVAPKKAALQQAEAEYAALMEGLAAKKAELGAVVAALNALNDKLAALQVGDVSHSSLLQHTYQLSNALTLENKNSLQMHIGLIDAHWVVDAT